MTTLHNARTCQSVLERHLRKKICTKSLSIPKRCKLECWVLQKCKFKLELLPSNCSLCAGTEQLSGGERLTLGKHGSWTCLLT